MAEKVTILFLTANPVRSARLRTDQDYRDTSQAIRGALERSRFRVVPVVAARYEDLQRELRRHQPQIVHFSGHADEHGILLEDDAGRPMPVDGEALAGLFQILSGIIHLVVLSACESRATAEAFRAFVDYTIAMRRPITDRAVIAFNTTFYESLADGQPIPIAFDYALSSLRVEHREEVDVPELLRRPGVVDPVMAPRPVKTRKRQRNNGISINGPAGAINIIQGNKNRIG